MGKPKRTTLRNRADKLFSQVVRSRGGCEARGSGVGPVRCSPVLQTAHIIPRRYLAIRWDQANALCLCGGHHVFFTHHPVEWGMFVEDRWPGRYDRLREKALAPHGKPDYESIIAGLEQVLAVD